MRSENGSSFDTIPIGARVYRMLRGVLAFGCEGLARLDARFPFLPPAWETPARFHPHFHPRSQTERPKAVAGAMPSRSAIWAHCASLGEAEGLLRLFEHLQPEVQVVFTAQTPAGLERLRKGIADRPAWRAAVAPFESPRAVRRFVQAHGIGHVLLYESELWPAYLETASRFALPIFWVGAHCGSRTARRWSWVAPLVRHHLAHLTWIQARSRADAARIRVFYTGRLSVGCDAKGLGKVSRKASQVARTVSSPQPGLALYCLHADEWRYFQSALPILMQTFRIYVLPRKPAEFAYFRQVLQPLGFAAYGDGARPETSERPLLIDVLGRVGDILPHAQIALVGGSWNGGGGHALWEPLSQGMRLIAGPSLDKQEPLATQLRRAGLLTIWNPASGLSLPALVGSPIPASRSDTGDSQRIAVFLAGQRASQTKALSDLRSVLTAYPLSLNEGRL